MSVLPAALATLAACGLTGASLLAAVVPGERARRQPVGFAALAVLVGTCLAGTGVTLLAVAGLRTTLALEAAVAGALVVVGALARWRLPARGARWFAGPTPTERSVCAAAGGVALVVLVLTARAALHAQPWLPDTATTWMPKGIALQQLGLDPRLFTPLAGYDPYPHPDYPLLWPVLSTAPLLLTGHVDPRAPLLMETLLLAAFAGSLRFLLRPLVRPAAIDLSLMLLLLAPALLRQTRSGGADLPLACALVLGAVALGVLVARGGREPALVAFAALAAACALKSEGALEALVVVVFALAAAAAWRRRRLPAVGAVALAAGLTFLPFALWRSTHGIYDWSGIPPAAAFDGGWLGERSARPGIAVQVLGGHLLTFREWLWLPPLALGLCLLAALRPGGRWAAVAAGCALALLALLVWAVWADPAPLVRRLGGAGARIVDPIALASAPLAALAASGAVAPARALRAWRAAQAWR